MILYQVNRKDRPNMAYIHEIAFIPLKILRRSDKSAAGVSLFWRVEIVCG